MKKKTVYFFVFDGFSDWEASYAMVGISKSDGYQLKTIAMEKAMIKSMGGLTVFPDNDFRAYVDLEDIDADNTAMLILPGGMAWEEKTNNGIGPLVSHCFKMDIPIAAICGATIFLADRCILNDREHTSNDLGYLHALSPSYLGHDFYIERPSVKGRNLVTANATAGVDFARDIFDVLDIAEETGVRSWFQYFDRIAI